jgi:hypothetical protein
LAQSGYIIANNDGSINICLGHRVLMGDTDYLLESLVIFRRIDFFVLYTMLVKELLDSSTPASAR